MDISGNEWTIAFGVLGIVVSIYVGLKARNVVVRAAISLHHAPVRRTVYIAAPHFGSAKAYLALHPAHRLDIFKRWDLRLVANRIWRRIARKVGGTQGLEKQLKSIGTQLQSLYELLPDENS